MMAVGVIYPCVGHYHKIRRNGKYREKKHYLGMYVWVFFPPSLGGGGGAAPLSHVAMSAPANVVFSCSELGQPGPFLSWLWHSVSERLDIP